MTKRTKEICFDNAQAYYRFIQPVGETAHLPR